MIYDLIAAIEATLETEIKAAMKKEEGLNGNKHIDRIFWVCMLFSKSQIPDNLDLAVFYNKYLKKNFHTTQGSSWGFCWAEYLWGKPKQKAASRWDTHKFEKFIELLDDNGKSQLIQAINQINGINIENTSEIPELLKEQYLNLVNEFKIKATIEITDSSDNQETLPYSDFEIENVKNNNSKKNILVICIITLVLATILLIILFIAKNNPDHHVDDKILPNNDITTSLTSTTSIVSTEITTSLLTSSFSSNIQTSTASSDTTVISTLLPATEKIDNTGNKVDPTVIVVTVNVNNNSHSNTETHTESSQNNNRQDPPVTQAPATHTPITTSIQVPRSDPTVPEISINSTNANKGQSDVCVEVVFSDLTLRGNYDKINLNFNALYDRDLVFKNYTISEENAEINEITNSNGYISFNMSSDSCVNDITISLYFDIPNNALDGEYVVYMREDASRIVLLKSTYNYFWDDYDLNEFQKYDSLYRHGVIYVS